MVQVSCMLWPLVVGMAFKSRRALVLSRVESESGKQKLSRVAGAVAAGGGGSLW